MPETWTFEILENGFAVVEGTAPTYDAAFREAAHYLVQYAQDGGKCEAIIHKDEECFEPPTVNNEVA